MGLSFAPLAVWFPKEPGDSGRGIHRAHLRMALREFRWLFEWLYPEAEGLYAPRVCVVVSEDW